MRLTKTTACDILRQVEGEERFFNSDGSVFASLAEFDAALSGMPQDVFNNHCNSQRCDFAAWIEDVLHDAVLAKDIRKAKGVRAKIEARISERLGQLAKYR
ncbi:MAG: hypothetical protein NUV61_01765 [Candidatus Azambacteria bacterium]|nr:hypothetical protein [Candidatus Azambacteria bacterium]